jgi:pilus assembly protein Flp/PilA
MKTLIFKVFVHIRGLREEHGQDLIEYALIAALIALAATTGMSSVATSINAAFGSVGTHLATYTS